MAEVTKRDTDEILEILEHVGVTMVWQKKDLLKVAATLVVAGVVSIELHSQIKAIPTKIRKDIEKKRQRRESDEVAKRTQVPD